eukprot:TRINITY_DN8539_c0_g1_i1.p1 TRINITY_DN8539_c0_g1~~TRINITY_DN8539_c0_g1_i1.p1  ORF type:complete len:403 (+),score=124.32 TRINITY_DN8539_c0_g1_i1:80-1288(+)
MPRKAPGEAPLEDPETTSLLSRSFSQPPASWTVLVAVCVYVASGIVQPILVDYLRYQGFLGARGPDAPITNMGVVLNTLGMSMIGAAYLARHPWPTMCRRQYRVVALVCSVDVLAQSMVMYGQLKVGGGLYVLLYSSSMVWTAVLAHFVLGRELHPQQWVGVGEVTLGLVLSNVHLFLFAEPSASGITAAWDPLVGSCVLLLGAVCSACYFVTCEWLMAGGGGEYGRTAKPIPHMALAGMTGISTFAILLGYNFVLTLKHGVRALYIEPVRAAGGSWADIAAVSPLLVLANAVHAAAYFFMLHSLGAVSAGVMKGVRAVAVFVLSATIYCSVDRNQCIVLMENGHLGPGVLKCFAMYIVVRGVFAYSVAPRVAIRRSEDPNHPNPEGRVTESFCSEFSYGNL